MNPPTKFTTEQREELIERWKHSGKGKKEFADENGIKYMTFIDWVRKRKRKKSIEVPAEQFIPLEIPSSSIFAELNFGGKKIVFHQRISAEYLKIILRSC